MSQKKDKPGKTPEATPDAASGAMAGNYPLGSMAPPTPAFTFVFAFTIRNLPNR